MRRSYSYAEAAKILGGKEHPVVVALDKLLGGTLLLASAGTLEVLSLFDAKPDFVRLSNELINAVSEKRRGLSRYGRTQRMQAAHAVIVMVAFFEEAAALVPEFRLMPEDKEHVRSFEPFQTPFQLPSAAIPYEANLERIRLQYRLLADELASVLESLATWDELNETQRGRVQASLANDLAPRAVARYEELFRQLAVDFPELAVWCSVEDGRAGRAALARIEKILMATTTDIVPERRLVELAGVYRGVLDRPLVKSSEVPDGLSIPTLGDAYVNPRFQVLIEANRLSPSLQSWWSEATVRTDLDAYMIGYLTSPEAFTTPLLVLGDPGSGKSLLTEMLAARLPASDFAVVRVELRNAPADADLVRQIEHGLHLLLDEPVSWAEFSRNTGGAVPVVMLDGFDELLQATGVSQPRYLEMIAEHQAKLLRMGRPAVFVVTSRLSVCAGLELPAGTQVVRLMPFSDEQVRQWLDVWNAANPPLPAEVVLQYPDLASQPLLLLMLALYDAVDGSFQRDHLSMGQAELYERLLWNFAEREVAKSDGEVAVSDVEFELDRLSVVALAMFNRGAQWVAEHHVTADLHALLEVESPDRSKGARTPLSAGETVLGRFFFVQKSEATREDRTKLRTYEFLHATFGEYLVARFVWRALEDLARQDSARSRRKSTVDDGELFSLLSFTVVTTSRPILNFLAEFAERSDRDGLFDLVARLFEARDARRTEWGAYEPVSLPDSARQAKYAVNLVVLALVLRPGRSVSGLVVSEADWSRAALFWKSRLTSGEWDSVVRTIVVEHLEAGMVTPMSIGGSLEHWQERSSLILEPNLTLDPVSNGLLTMAKPLVVKYPAEVAAVVAELMGTPVDRCVPVLGRLAKLDRDVLWVEVCRRLGTGGDDEAIFAVADVCYADPLDLGDEDYLDARLRLYERGSQVGDTWMDLRTLLRSMHLDVIGRRRPDLIKRARVAAAELGLELER